MGRLKQEEFVHLAPGDEGTERYDHDECPAGADTKRRLYVTRKEDGVIVAYCHNCGNSGVSLHRRTHYRSHDSSSGVRNETKEVIEMPLNVEFDPKYWPIEAKVWIGKSGIPLTSTKKYALAYDKDTRRMVIPKYNLDNELVMYQTRNIGLDDGPKYTTVRKIDAEIHDPIGSNGTKVVGHGKVVVLCEDMLSAIKLDDMVGIDAIPLYSSNVKFQKLLTPLSKYGTIIVWLDNDNIEVNRHRDLLVKNCKMLGKNVKVVSCLSDPKHYGVRLIQDELISLFKEDE